VKNIRKKTTKLSNDLMGVKKEMFEQAMYGENVVLSDSLLNLSLEIQGQLEKVTFQHFLQLKQICTPKQREKLFKLMHRLLGPPEREGMGGPPPPPKDKQTPARG
jgi:protein CpxP